MSLTNTTIKQDILPFIPNISLQDYTKQWRDAMAKAEAEFETFKNFKGEATKDNFLIPLDRLCALISNVDMQGSVWQYVAVTKEMRDEGGSAEQAASKLDTLIGMSSELSRIVESIDLKALDPLSVRSVEKWKQAFRRSGANLDPAGKEEYRQLDEERTQFKQAFQRNINEATKTLYISPEDLDGLPEDYIESHPVVDRKVAITTNIPDAGPIMQYCKSDAVRKELYTARGTRAWPENEHILKRMLEVRYRQATLLGYENWPAYQFEPLMVKDQDTVAQFLEDVSVKVKPLYERHKEDAEAILKEHGFLPTSGLRPWQVSLANNLLSKRQLEGYNPQRAREFFQVKLVIPGIIALAEKLFRLRFVQVDSLVPMWHDSVTCYEVHDEIEGKMLGLIYMDLFPRKDKFKSACMYPLYSGIDGVQHAQSVLIANFPSGEGALMDYSDVMTAWHEYGHCIHNLLGASTYNRFSSTTVERDFAETPSQLLEVLLESPEILRTFAFNRAGEPIDDLTLKGLMIADRITRPIATWTQLFFSKLAVTQLLHTRNLPNGEFQGDTVEIYKETIMEHGYFEYTPGHRFQFSFIHLAGYGAAYYSYQWALAIARDIASVFKENGIFDPDTCLRYRRCVLEVGSSVDRKDMVENFLGRPFNNEAYSKWLAGKD